MPTLAPPIQSQGTILSLIVRVNATRKPCPALTTEFAARSRKNSVDCVQVSENHDWALLLQVTLPEG